MKTDMQHSHKSQRRISEKLHYKKVFRSQPHWVLSTFRLLIPGVEGTLPPHPKPCLWLREAPTVPLFLPARLSPRPNTPPNANYPGNPGSDAGRGPCGPARLQSCPHEASGPVCSPAHCGPLAGGCRRVAPHSALPGLGSDAMHAVPRAPQGQPGLVKAKTTTLLPESSSRKP